MDFIRPGILWLLLLVVPLAGLHFSRRLGFSALRATVLALLRALTLIVLVAALARPVMERPAPLSTVVAVVDLSTSLDDADLDGVQASVAALASTIQPNETLKLVVFEQRARQIELEGMEGVSSALAPLCARMGAEPGSALAEALELAGALVPRDARGRIVLYTDGLETRGDALAAATRLAERGIPITAQPVGAARSDEVILRSLTLPGSAGLGATVDLEAEIESAQATGARMLVRCAADGEETATSISLRPGRQTVTCPCPLRHKGVVTYTVAVESAPDTLLENNSLSTAIFVEPPQRVCVLENADGAPATTALTELLGIAAVVTRVEPAALAAPGALEDLDLLVIADTPAEALPDGVQRRIRDAVVEGLALLVTGGRRAFGPGGYANTPLAEVMPVRFGQNVERRDPSVTVVVIIDTSGSMGGARVNLAKEIARLAIARLKPHDKVGIVEFYGSKRWAAPVQPASNAIDLQRALNRLSAGGGTVILPAIEEAYYALENVRTRTKHVLVLTDGGVERGAFEPLIRKMADHGITLSTVMVGPGGHSAFLASLAQWGRGRFYAAPDRFNLPEIIVKQPESAMMPPLVERPTRLVAKADDPITDDIDWAAAPPIHGYVETEARPTAQVTVESDLAHPVLAHWRYGLGTVAALTTQLGGEWSGELAKWPPYGKLVSNLVRSMCPRPPSRALRLTPLARPGATEVQIDRCPVGLPPDPAGRASTDFAAVELTLTGWEAGPPEDPGLTPEAVRRWVLDPVQASRWNHRVADLAPGVYKLTARTQNGHLGGSAALVVPPVREVTSLGPDAGLLQRLNALHAQAAQRAAELSPTDPRQPEELWPGLVAAALVIFLLSVLIRRWPERARHARVPGAAAVCLLIYCLTAPESAAAQDPQPAPTPALSPAVTARCERALQAESRADAQVQFADACRLALEQDGDLDRLVASLRQRRGENDRALWLLASAARDNGDFATAQEALVKLTSIAPHDYEGWAELARVEELLGNDSGALAALESAISLEPTAERRLALRVRQALLLYDNADPAAGAEALRAALAELPDAERVTAFCAHLAALNGDNQLAVTLLKPSGGGKKQFHEHLFRGLFYLRLDQPNRAEQEFREAYRHGPLARDRRFALERTIACARRSGQLAVLADEWLGTEQLTLDQLSSLVALLRELGRPDDALALLQRPPQSPEQRRLLESAEFQREVIATAAEAGREVQAETAYRALLERQPERLEWRVGLARLMLLDGRREAAAHLFQDAVESFADAQLLLALAEAARDLALDESALAAARKAGRHDARARLRAGLFEADLARLRGDSDRALVLLKELTTLAGDDVKAILPLAETFERYGDKAEALRLFERLYRRSRGEDALLRLAWLLEENQHFDRAYALWSDLWRTTAVPARLHQAEERMLDLAARTGKLADLAIELEEKLDEGQGGERDLALLVSIYSTANDPVSAAEILYDFGRRSGDQVGMLQRLARVYLSCEQFGRCNAVLHRLVKLDPENAADYLQQIAIVALERRRPHEAKAALAQLAAVAGNPQVVDEFSAGLLDMIGLHAEAAESYGRLLARYPDRIEAFLLWGNALQAAGRTERAVARFQTLVEDAQEDDLFTVAVDGLLNLDARPAVLRSARRRLLARIAAKPDKVYLYNLAVDVLDALGETARMQDTLEQAVVVAGERRVQLLRELMETARTDGQTDRLMGFGRSLLALGELVPPQVYLDLGEAMIKQGMLHSAERVFERARVGVDFSSIQQRVATYYDEAGLPAAAERIIRQLLIGQPDDVPLLIRSGGLCEQLGHFERAFEQYYRGVDLMLRRLPAVVRPDETAEAQTTNATGKRRRRYRAANLDELTQYFESAANGLLNAARTPELRERLLQELPTRVQSESETLIAERTLMPALERNPRLHRLAAFARHVAFALHRPALAERMDRHLLEHYPRDTALHTALLQARLDWGLYAQAVELAACVPDSETVPDAITCDTLLADPQALNDTLAQDGLDEALGCLLLPRLIMAGRDDEARKVVRATRLGSPSGATDTATVMIAGALALDDYAGLRLWTTRWLDACQALPAGEDAANSIRQCVGFVWNALRPEDRAVVLEQVQRLVRGAEDEGRLPLHLLYRSLAKGSASHAEAADEFDDAVLRDRALSVETIADVLRAVPAVRRPSLVRAATAARKPTEVRKFLMQLSGVLNVPADDRLADTFAGLFRAAPPFRLRRDRAYSDVTAGRWHRNAANPEFGRRLGEVLLSEMPNETAVLTAVAVARNHAGLHDEAMLLADEALEALLAPKQPDFQQAQMWTDLAALMQPEDLQETLAEVGDLADIEGATPTLLHARGVLLEAVGQRMEALDAYRSAFKLAPTNRSFSRKVIRLLRESGREAALARLLSAHLIKSTIMESFEWRTLATVYCNLYDPARAAAAAQRLEGPLRASQVMYAARMMGRTDEVRTVFRSFLINNRNRGRFYNPFWPVDPSPGGMSAYLHARPRRARTTMFAAVADLPFAEAEFAALLDAAPPDRRDVPGLVAGLARATAFSKTRAGLLDTLLDAHRNRALTTKDYGVILELAKDDPQALPEPLTQGLGDFLMHLDPTNVETAATLTALAQFYVARGNSGRAQRILRWLVAYDLRSGRKSAWLEDRLERLDQYLAALDPEARVRKHRRLLRHLSPTPLDAPSDQLDAALLERWAAAGDAAELEAQLATRCKLLDECPSAHSYPTLCAAMAQGYASTGRFDDFAAMVELALTPPPSGWAFLHPPDARKMLPPADVLDDPASYVEFIATRVEARASNRVLAPRCATQALCLAGLWCAENGLRNQACALLPRAERLAGELGSHWLWIADLARAAEQEDQAIEVETRLLEAEALPLPRVPRLLEAVEARRGQADADQLAVQVAEYSDHPEVLRRALRSARASGDAAAVSMYLERQRAVTSPVVTPRSEPNVE